MGINYSFNGMWARITKIKTVHGHNNLDGRKTNTARHILMIIRMSTSKFFCMMVYLTVVPLPVSGFLDVCDAPRPCQCLGDNIRCDNFGMPTIPTFNLSKHYNMVYVNLQHNRIFVIPQDTFQGITTTKMYMDLSYNNIYDIHEEAFKGIESAITILKLNNNNLRKLPPVFAKLINLVYLEIQKNPIKTFDSHVLSSIGSHLQIFFVGSDVLTQWPLEFGNLTKLDAFYLFDIQSESIPEDAFTSFAVTLRNLRIENSNLSEIPVAVCDLQNMDAFEFINNKNLNESDTIMPNCSMPLTKVKTAKFDGNDFSVFPNVFQIFPDLTSLYVVSNTNLRDANDSMISQETQLRNLYVYDNDFHYIPPEIRALHNLITLELHGNQITILQESDVSGLEHLARLNLNDNPLTDIEFDALRNLTALTTLSLDNTNITSVPEAIVGTVSLNTISLMNTKLNCTCEALLWMKDWKELHTVRITGTCAYPRFGKDVAAYITQQLPKC